MNHPFFSKRSEGSEPEEKIRSRDLYVRPHKEKKPGKIYGLLFIALCIAAFAFLLRKDAEDREDPGLRKEMNETVIVENRKQSTENRVETTIPSYSQNPGQATVSYDQYIFNSIVYEIRGTAAYVVGTVENNKDVKYLTVEKKIFGFPVVEICEGAFRDCTKLREISVSDSVIILGSDAFSNCERLEKVRLSESLITVGNRAFAGCTYLKTITIPSTVKELKADVFEGDASLLQISLPSSCRIPEGDDPFGLGEQLVLDWY